MNKELMFRQLRGEGISIPANNLVKIIVGHSEQNGQHQYGWIPNEAVGDAVKVSGVFSNDGQFKLENCYTSDTLAFPNYNTRISFDNLIDIAYFVRIDTKKGFKLDGMFVGGSSRFDCESTERLFNENDVGKEVSIYVDINPPPFDYTNIEYDPYGHSGGGSQVG